MDDGDLQCRRQQGDTHEEIHSDTQQATTSWARLLMATGGSLWPEKCFWYLVSRTRRNGKWEYEERTADDPENEEIYVPQHGADDAKIERLSPFEERKTIGVFTSPAGTWNTQLQRIRNKMDTWTNKV